MYFKSCKCIKISFYDIATMESHCSYNSASYNCTICQTVDAHIKASWKNEQNMYINYIRLDPRNVESLY